MGSSPKYRLNSHTDWLKIVKHCDWLIGKSFTENRLPRENYKGDSRVTNQNPAVPIINQSESDFKRYFGDDPNMETKHRIQATYCRMYNVTSYKDLLNDLF